MVNLFHRRRALKAKLKLTFQVFNFLKLTSYIRTFFPFCSLYLNELSQMVTMVDQITISKWPISFSCGYKSVTRSPGGSSVVTVCMVLLEWFRVFWLSWSSLLI